MKPMTRAEIIDCLKLFGFDGPFVSNKSNKHPSFMIKGSLKLKLPNPHKKVITDPLLSNMRRQAGISERECRSA